MLATLTPQAIRTVKSNPERINEKSNPERINEVSQGVEQLGVSVVQQSATLGEFDFLSIVETPDERAMLRLAVELRSRGTARYRSLAAIPIDDFISSL
jgi:uncharacterized protein with GYD domain